MGFTSRFLEHRGKEKKSKKVEQSISQIEDLARSIIALAIGNPEKVASMLADHLVEFSSEGMGFDGNRFIRQFIGFLTRFNK